MNIQPYLFFEGRCEEALEFYRQALDAEDITIMRYRDNPQPQACAPGTEDNIMHASFRVGDSVIFASDGRCSGNASFDGFSLSLTTDTGSAAQRMFAALAEGGTILVPLEKTFFSPQFGMLKDRFGVHWMIWVQQNNGNRH